MGAPADVGPGEDLAAQVLCWQSLKGEPQHLEVIGGGVGGGVAGAKDGGRGLSCLYQVTEQG